MSTYPEGHLYEALYAKYIYKRPVAELVDKAGDINGKAVLDLCCGTGRILKTCVARGAVVTGIDSCPQMMEGLEKWLKENSPESNIYANNVESYLLYCSAHRVKHDVVFCRQAVNYWLDRETAVYLAKTVKPGGKFIFNTFGTKPGEVPVIKEYYYQQHHFVEASWRVGETVHHVQIREGLPPHTTSFKWISPEGYVSMLGEYFDIEVSLDRSTAIYTCTRKA